MQPDRTAELAALMEEHILLLDGAMGTMIQGHHLDEAGYRGMGGGWPRILGRLEEVVARS